MSTLNTNSSKVINIGILGAANIVPFAIITPAKKFNNINVYAVAARDKSKAEKFAKKHNIGIVHDSYDALLADENINLIYVPLPNSHHCDWSIKALEAGKDVLCEKPLASNSEEAKRMQETANRVGKKLIIAFHNRYHPVMDYVKSRLPEIGELQHMDAFLCTPAILALRPRDFRFKYETAGGAMMDLGCYCIELLKNLTGQELTLKDAKAHAFSKTVDRGMTANFTYESGATATLICSLASFNPLHFFDFRAIIKGSEGEIKVINPLLPQFYHKIKIKTKSGVETKKLKAESTYYYQMKAVQDYLLDDKPLPFSIDVDVKNMELIDNIYIKAGMKLRGLNLEEA